MANEIPPSLARFIRAQHGVVTRKQALRAGLTEPAVRSRLRSGSWRQLYRGVYLTYGGPPRRESSMWAAVLYCGRGAVLSHQTAAELHGLNVKPHEKIHVTIPADRRVVAAPGLSIHLSGRPLDPPDAHRDPPHTPICDTLLDLADAATDLDTVCGWITDAFEKEKLHAVQLRFALSQRTRARWRAQLTDLLDCAAAGDHSVLEFRYTRDVERAHGLPESVRQVPFTRADGREGRRDRVYRDFAVIVELDGRLWHPPEAISADKRRDRAAAAVGMVSLRYEWTDVNSRACEAAAEIAQVLRTRGWTGTPRACFPGCPAPSSASAASVTARCGLRRRVFAPRSAPDRKRPPSLLRTRSLRAPERQIGPNGEMSGTEQAGPRPEPRAARPRWWGGQGRSEPRGGRGRESGYQRARGGWQRLN